MRSFVNTHILCSKAFNSQQKKNLIILCDDVVICITTEAKQLNSHRRKWRIAFTLEPCSYSRIQPTT